MPGESYIDTSALAKWYLPEQGSEAVRDYLAGLGRAYISSLTITEMRCLLARRRRDRQLDAVDEQKAYSNFENNILQGHLSVLDVKNHHFSEAGNMVGLLPQCALRTLDALHLAVLTDTEISEVATADKVFAEASAALGLTVRSF